MSRFKWVNLKGDLFATTFCFVAQSVIRLGSSLVLTRVLRPESYGIITILISLVFVVEMLADIGVTTFVIRDKNAELPEYLNTAWTLRLGRATVNGLILFFGAPIIATQIYNLPELVTPLRVFSLWFILTGLESMSFPLAIRRKQTRITVYSELVATCLTTTFTVLYCLHFKDYWGLLYGTLLNRLLMSVFSYQFYKESRPRLQFKRSVAKEIFHTTKYTVPSGLMTLVLSQFDKILFLRLFDLRLLGVYGLAANIAGPVESLIQKISQTVLYPRCAHDFRENPQTFVWKYYTENVKLFVSIMVLPAAIGGAAQLIIAILYPSRYAEAGAILQAFMLRGALISMASPAEDLLVAAGEYRVIMMGGVFRVLWMFAGSLIGYYFFGFTGFIYGYASNALPPLIYFLWLQRKKGMLIARYEIYKAAFLISIAIFAYLAAQIPFALWPALRMRAL